MMSTLCWQPLSPRSLTLWIMTILAVAAGQCNKCGDLQFLTTTVVASPLPPLNVDASTSPLFGVFETNISSTRNLDNYCFTYFPLTLNNFLQFRSYVFSDGSFRVERYFMRDIPNKVGFMRVEGLDYCGTSTRILDEISIGLGCPISFVLVRRYLYGNCGVVCDLNGKQVRYALSAVRRLPRVCIELLKAVANSQPQLGFLDDSDFIVCPNNRPLKCVTQYNNASCINSYMISDEDSISLPYCDCFSTNFNV